MRFSLFFLTPLLISYLYIVWLNDIIVYQYSVSYVLFVSKHTQTKNDKHFEDFKWFRLDYIDATIIWCYF